MLKWTLRAMAFFILRRSSPVGSLEQSYVGPFRRWRKIGQTQKVGGLDHVPPES